MSQNILDPLDVTTQFWEDAKAGKLDCLWEHAVKDYSLLQITNSDLYSSLYADHDDNQLLYLFTVGRYDVLHLLAHKFELSQYIPWYVINYMAGDGNINAIKWILANNIMLVEDLRTNNKLNLLGHACENGHIPMIKYLKSIGYCMEDVLRNDCDSFLNAIETGHMHVLEELKDWGLTRIVALPYIDSYTMLKIGNNDNVCVLNWLYVNFGYCINDIIPYLKYLIRWQVESNKISVLQWLLDKGLPKKYFMKWLNPPFIYNILEKSIAVEWVFDNIYSKKNIMDYRLEIDKFVQANTIYVYQLHRFSGIEEIPKQLLWIDNYIEKRFYS